MQIRRISKMIALSVFMIICISACSASEETPQPITPLPSSVTPLPTEPPTSIPSPSPSHTPAPILTSSPTFVTIHLEADGSGDFPTLEEAVENAPEGATLLLGAGVFHLNEALEIDKPLNLVGQGMEETEIVSDAAEYTVHVKVKGTFHAEGITFRHEGSAFADAVDVEDAQVTFDRCRFTGGVMNPDSEAAGTDQPCPEQCSLHKRRGSGLRLQENASGSIQDNLAEENFTGIWVFGQNITLEGNLVTKNKAGMAFGSSTNAIARENQVEANEYNGIVIAMNANPTLEKNTSINNKNNGFLFLGDATGTAIRNICESNQLSGMRIEGQAAPTLEENLCDKNAEDGLVYLENSGGVARLNQCSENKESGIVVIGHAHPVLENNLCNSNAINGIVIAENATGDVRGNECNSNQRTGILITDSAQATLEENTCSQNVKFGIAVGINSVGVLRRNTCRENLKHGILVAENATATLEENVCTSNTQAGIAFIDNSSGTATRNQCYGNETGIYVENTANPELGDNDCHDNTKNDFLDER